jgi:hypothetical protein
MRIPRTEDLVNADQFAELLADLRIKQPALFTKYALPKYAPQNGFRSYTHLTDMMAMNEADYEGRVMLFGRDEAIATVAAIVHTATWRMKQFDFPLAYVSRDIADAAANTQLPEWLLLQDMRWPLRSMTFMLPQGQFVSPSGYEAGALSVCSVSAEETAQFAGRPGVPPRLFTSVARHESGSIFVWATMREKTGLWKMWGMDRPMTGTVSAMGIEFAQIGDVAPGWEEAEAIDNAWWTQTMGNVAMNLLMLMVDRPELVESGRPLKRIKAGKGQKQVLWQPRWVGRTYRRQTASEGPQKGSHASPRAHWRIGHWRQQAHGPKLTLRKSIWIEPVIVNPI